MQHEHYTHTASDIPSSTALSIFFFLLHFLLMQLLSLLQRERKKKEVQLMLTFESQNAF